MSALDATTAGLARQLLMLPSQNAERADLLAQGEIEELRTRADVGDRTAAYALADVLA